jgi:hypothetical protein
MKLWEPAECLFWNLGFPEKFFTTFYEILSIRFRQEGPTNYLEGTFRILYHVVNVHSCVAVIVTYSLFRDS